MSWNGSVSPHGHFVVSFEMLLNKVVSKGCHSLLFNSNFESYVLQGKQTSKKYYKAVATRA